MLLIVGLFCFDPSCNQEQRLELEQLRSDYEHLRTQERHKSRQLEDLTWVLATFQTFLHVEAWCLAAFLLWWLTVILSCFWLGDCQIRRANIRLTCLELQYQTSRQLAAAARLWDDPFRALHQLCRQLLALWAAEIVAFLIPQVWRNAPFWDLLYLLNWSSSCALADISMSDMSSQSRTSKDWKKLW